MDSCVIQHFFAERKAHLSKRRHMISMATQILYWFLVHFITKVREAIIFGIAKTPFRTEVKYPDIVKWTGKKHGGFSPVWNAFFLSSGIWINSIQKKSAVCRFLSSMGLDTFSFAPINISFPKESHIFQNPVVWYQWLHKYYIQFGFLSISSAR